MELETEAKRGLSTLVDIDRTLPWAARNLGANDSVEEIKLNAARRAEDRIIMVGGFVVVCSCDTLLQS